MPDPRVPPARREGRALLVGLAALLGLGVLALILLWATLGRRDGDAEQDRPAVAQTEVEGAEPELAAAAAAPDREAVRAAYAEVARVYGGERVAGLAQAGQKCFAALGRGSASRDLDYCLAFDAFGAAFAHREAGAPAPPGSYFGQTESRALQAGEVVLAGSGDPSARLVQIRQLALEVAREGAPTYAQAAPATPLTPSAETAPALEPEPTPPPATTDGRAAPAAPSRPARPAERTPPAQPVQRAEARPAAEPAGPESVAREAYAAARDRGPTAAEVAAARSREGRGPSFNCRFARSTSERIVCEDPRLAALDRRLNAAYEDAIAAGVSRRRLRAEQDSWLLTREHAAPDPDAVEDAYRRRIEELQSLR